MRRPLCRTRQPSDREILRLQHRFCPRLLCFIAGASCAARRRAGAVRRPDRPRRRDPTAQAWVRRSPPGRGDPNDGGRCGNRFGARVGRRVVGAVVGGCRRRRRPPARDPGRDGRAVLAGRPHAGGALRRHGTWDVAGYPRRRGSAGAASGVASAEGARPNPLLCATAGALLRSNFGACVSRLSAAPPFACERNAVPHQPSKR